MGSPQERKPNSQPNSLQQIAAEALTPKELVLFEKFTQKIVSHNASGENRTMRDLGFVVPAGGELERYLQETDAQLFADEAQTKMPGLVEGFRQEVEQSRGKWEKVGLRGRKYKIPLEGVKQVHGRRIEHEGFITFHTHKPGNPLISRGPGEFDHFESLNISLQEYDQCLLPAPVELGIAFDGSSTPTAVSLTWEGPLRENRFPHPERIKNHFLIGYSSVLDNFITGNFAWEMPNSSNWPLGYERLIFPECFKSSQIVFNFDREPRLELKQELLVPRDHRTIPNNKSGEKVTLTSSYTRGEEGMGLVRYPAGITPFERLCMDSNYWHYVYKRESEHKRPFATHSLEQYFDLLGSD